MSRATHPQAPRSRTQPRDHLAGREAIQGRRLCGDEPGETGHGLLWAVFWNQSTSRLLTEDRWGRRGRKRPMLALSRKAQLGHSGSRKEARLPRGRGSASKV